MSVKELRQKLNERFLEREALVDGVLVALISGEPLIIIGPPGTAKSAICNTVAEVVSAKYFSWLMTKFTVPEELFGPLSLKALEKDEYVRVTKDKLPEANVVFIDEVGKASSSISNTLLTIMNEKTFHNGGSAVQVPLRAFFGASNEVPQSDDLSAFYDRFVLRYFVDNIASDTSARALLSGINVKFPTMSLKDVDSLRKKADSIQLTDKIMDLMLQIRREITQAGIRVSDRKMLAQSKRVLCAFAVLNDRDHVIEDDLEILANILWSTPDQISKVKKIVNKIVNPLNEKIDSIADGVYQLFNELSNGGGDAIEGFKKLKHAEKSLMALGDPSKNPKLQKVLDQVKTAKRDVAKKHLDLDE